MKPLLVKSWYIILLAILGIAGGFFYWKYVGCNSGSCPITAHWHSSSVVGGVLGYLSGSMISDFRKKSDK